MNPRADVGDSSDSSDSSGDGAFSSASLRNHDAVLAHAMRVEGWKQHKEHFTGDALAFLSEVIPAMNDGNHDRSEAQYDHFDVGWYIDVNIGQWNKDYIVTA